MIKLIILKLHAEKLKQLLFMFDHEFLSSTADHQTENLLRRHSRLVFKTLCLIYISSLGYIFGSVILPLTRGGRELPLNSYYGFNLTRSPVYEIVYSVQTINQLLTVLQGISAHDDLMFVLCSNVIAQFIMLNNALAKVLNEEFARQKLGRYIRHHNMLLR